MCEAEKYQMRTAQHEKCLGGEGLGYLPEPLGLVGRWSLNCPEDSWRGVIPGRGGEWAKGKGTETGESLGDLQKISWHYWNLAQDAAGEDKGPGYDGLMSLDWFLRHLGATEGFQARVCSGRLFWLQCGEGNGAGRRGAKEMHDSRSLQLQKQKILR